MARAPILGSALASRYGRNGHLRFLETKLNRMESNTPSFRIVDAAML